MKIGGKHIVELSFIFSALVVHYIFYHVYYGKIKRNENERSFIVTTLGELGYVLLLIENETNYICTPEGNLIGYIETKA